MPQKLTKWAYSLAFSLSAGVASPCRLLDLPGRPGVLRGSRNGRRRREFSPRRVDHQSRDHPPRRADRVLGELPHRHRHQRDVPVGLHAAPLCARDEVGGRPGRPARRAADRRRQVAVRRLRNRIAAWPQAHLTATSRCRRLSFVCYSANHRDLPSISDRSTPTAVIQTAQSVRRDGHGLRVLPCVC